MNTKQVLFIATIYLVLFLFSISAGPYGLGMDYFYSLPIIFVGLWWGGRPALFWASVVSVYVFFEAFFLVDSPFREWALGTLPLKILFFMSIGILFYLFLKNKRIVNLSRCYEDDLLRNTFYALDVLENEIEKVREHKRPLTIAIIDLDNFKKVNERLGNVQGDMLLRLFGKFLLRNLQPTDIVTRYGGDEFLVIFPGCSGELAQERLDNVKNKLREHSEIFRIEGIDNSFSFSAGIVEYSPDYANVREFFRAADDALFQAKEKGGDTSIIVKQDKSISFRNRRYWERVDLDDTDSIRVVLYDTSGRGHRITARNICIVGMMFFANVEIEEGSLYDLEIIFSDGERLFVDAKTVWKRRIGDGLYQVGVFLSQLSPQQKFLLHRKIEELKRK